jgi:hypothetical protein
MKRAAGLVLAALLAASEGDAKSCYALEVRGGSRIYAADQPVRKGRVFLFHRYPDGIYMSLASAEVEKVVLLFEPPTQEGLAPGQSMFIGAALEGPNAASPPVVPKLPPSDMAMDSGYGYYGSYWGGGGYVPPPRPPLPPSFVPPSRIGPNGFPILAPPGSPGSAPQPIGPNGFPILSPQPPAPRPRSM